MLGIPFTDIEIYEFAEVSESLINCKKYGKIILYKNFLLQLRNILLSFDDIL